MKSAVIVDCVRTPIGRSHPQTGCFRDVRADDLAVACIDALFDRTGLDRRCVEDVVFGVAHQTGQQGFNLARLAGLMAGLPVEAAGATVNRLCGSSLQALAQATHAIVAGAEDVHVVGGVEHMHRVPIAPTTDFNSKLFDRIPPESLQMGQTAELLARKYAVSRLDQDRFALRSHRRAARADAEGKFDGERIPVAGSDARGRTIRVAADQCVRSDARLESLAALAPVFQPAGGTVTAGNSSPRNDGAAAMLLMSRDAARRFGLEPLVRVRATAVAGVPPAEMGTGPVPAVHKALERARLRLSDVELIELNEAFAVQCLACLRLLELDGRNVNVNGGAIALGHPLGASGARIVTTLVHAMLDRNVAIGLAAMCVGGGQGIAVVLERV